MSYQATVLNLMISCPSDAKDGQEFIRKSINDWNDKHSERNQIILLPLYYETHVPAVLAEPADERPQAVINDYIVKMSDWLIVIFKNKIGTPTGKADSGTLEEIELFRKLYPYRPVSVYFYKQAQDVKVKEFKEKLPGIWKEYDNGDELQRNFSDDILHVVYKNTYFQQRQIDYRRSLEDCADFLLTTAFNDNKKLILVSKFSGQQALIETNDIKFFKCATALEYLYKQSFIEKKDVKGEVFILTESGMKRAKTLKFI